MAKLLQSALVVELAVGAAGELPTQVRLFRKGANRTRIGTFHLTAESERTCIASFDEGGVDLAFDLAHAMAGAKYATDPAAAGRAYGWGKLAMKDDGLYAVDLAWTPKGKQMLLDREVRYCSPMFRHSEDGTIQEVINVALTAIPATFGADPLMALTRSTDNEDPPMISLLALLSLPADTKEEVAAKKLGQLTAGHTALLQVTGAESVDAALGLVKGWKEAAAQHVELSRKFAEQAVAQRKADVKSALDAAAKEGKVAPAELEVLTAMGEASDAGLVQLKSYLSVKPKVVALSVAPAEPAVAPGSPAALSVSDAKVATMFGYSAKELAESIAKKGAQVPAGEKKPAA